MNESNRKSSLRQLGGSILGGLLGLVTSLLFVNLEGMGIRNTAIFGAIVGAISGVITAAFATHAPKSLAQRIGWGLFLGVIGGSLAGIALWWLGSILIADFSITTLAEAVIAILIGAFIGALAMRDDFWKDIANM